MFDEHENFAPPTENDVFELNEQQKGQEEQHFYNTTKQFISIDLKIREFLLIFFLVLSSSKFV